jgi:hypothetical protein
MSTPAPLPAPLSPDILVTDAQAELDHAAVRAGLVNDPLGHVIKAFSVAIGAMRDLSSQSIEAVRTVADEARQPMDAEARADMINRVVEAAAAGARGEVRSLSRRTLMVAVVSVAGLMVASGLCGWFIGSSSQAARVASHEASVLAAFRDGPDAAAIWATLMADNDGRLVAQTCKQTSARSDGGRRACVLGLWTEPPLNTGPRTIPVSK